MAGGTVLWIPWYSAITISFLQIPDVITTLQYTVHLLCLKVFEGLPWPSCHGDLLVASNCPQSIWVCSIASSVAYLTLSNVIQAKLTADAVMQNSSNHKIAVILLSWLAYFILLQFHFAIAGEFQVNLFQVYIFCNIFQHDSVTLYT